MMFGKKGEKKKQGTETFMTDEEYKDLCHNVTKRVYENNKQRREVVKQMYGSLNRNAKRQRNMTQLLSGSADLSTS